MRPAGRVVAGGGRAGGVFVRIILAGRCHRVQRVEPADQDGAGWLAALLSAAGIGEESLVCSFHYRMQR